MQSRRVQSHKLFERAKELMPGGVNSAARAFGGVGGTPIVFESAQGSTLVDVDGNRYIDYIGSWGPMIAGHAHPKVVKAVQDTAALGMSYGCPNTLETDLAREIIKLVPGLDLVRFVSSGTEACLSAVRLARGYTGRERILKFAGCYHGHGDSFLVKAGSGVLTLGLPNSPGVPKALADLTMTADFNNLDQVRAIFKEVGHEIAAVIVEPIAGNMNMITPLPGFLEGLRALCDDYGSVFIIDEVMTGFRVAPGGAQQHYGVTPDLSTFGKVIGAGMPVGAYGGKREIMEKIAPLGPVYQAGTLSGNPVAMAAGLANLQLIQEPGFFETLEARTRELCKGLEAGARAAGIPLQTLSIGGMFGFFFSETPVSTFAQAQACDIERFKRFFHACLKRGLYWAPSAYECGFTSSAHDEAIIAETVRIAAEAFAEIG